MVKITFMGAGSTVFARNVLGDCMCREALKGSHFALYDIDGERLRESEFILNTINNNVDGRATITTHLGVEARKEAGTALKPDRAYSEEMPKGKNT